MTETRQLVEKILAGDGEAFKLLIERHQRLVSHIVFRMIRNEAEREDLCQDVFIRVYRNIGGFKFKSKLSTWIARIAYNACGNYLEKKNVPLYEDLTSSEKTVESCPADGLQPDEYTVKKDISSRLKKEIDKLPVQYRTILTLYHLDEMSYLEICDIMNLPEGTVKSYLFRARKLLKERLLVKYQPEELWEQGI